MSNKVKILGVQTEPKIGDKKFNIDKITSMIDQHMYVNPDLVILPEVFSIGITTPEEFIRLSEPVPGPTYEKMASLAKTYGIYLLAGSIIEKCSDGNCRNNSMLFSPKGEMIANYYKLHMFSYYGSRESEFCKPGFNSVIAKTPIANIGMTVCYDLRFTELYRTLAFKGAQIIVVPAAWPYPRLNHWVTLNKARAIENQCFVVAVNQVGSVPPRRTNLGHSMVIDPWGSVIANAGEKEGVMMAQIDLDEVDKLRADFPILGDVNMDAYANVKVCEG